MAVKHLKPGETFSFPKEFGFTGSANGPSSPRPHPNRSADEFGDGMAKGGRVHPYTGGPAKHAAPAKKHSHKKPAAAAATVPADTARKAAVGALKIGALMGAHAAQRRSAVSPDAAAQAPVPMPAPPMAGPAGPALGGPPGAAPGPTPGDVPSMKKGGRFIKGAIKHPGRETRRAKANGVSVHQQMERDSHSSNRSVRAAGALGLRLTGGDLKPRNRKK